MLEYLANIFLIIVGLILLIMFTVYSLELQAEIDKHPNNKKYFVMFLGQWLYFYRKNNDHKIISKLWIRLFFVLVFLFIYVVILFSYQKYILTGTMDNAFTIPEDKINNKTNGSVIMKNHPINNEHK
jgi:hypothetical protein